MCRLSDEACTIKFQTSREVDILLHFWKHQELSRVTGHISCYVLLLLLLLTLLTSPFQLQLLTTKYD